MTLNVRNPLLLPEIASQVAYDSGSREQRNLAYTCKQLFRSIAPIIWKEIRGIEALMKLMPGVEILESSVNLPNGKASVAKHIILDEQLLAEDWTRLWLYAPLVQHLVLPSTETRPFYDDIGLHISGWQFLFPGLKGSVLLPNLRSLDARTLHHFPPFDRLALFTLFAPSSLQKLHFCDIPKQVPLHEQLPTRPLRLLLGTLSEKLPSDPPHVRIAREQWDLTKPALESLCPSVYQAGFEWFKQVPALMNLRDLTIVIFPFLETLWDDLYVLGHLPFLESMGLTCTDYADAATNWSKAPFPTHLFPSLRKLSLDHPPACLLRWIWVINPLVSGLSAARINGCPVDYISEHFDNLNHEQIVELAQLISQNSPSLMELWFYLPGGIFRRFEAMKAVCDLLAAVPLHTLEVEWDMLTDWDIFPPNYIDTAFPHLRHLHLSTALLAIYFPILPKVAKAFPNLEVLSIRPANIFQRYRPLYRNRTDHQAFQPIEIKIKKIESDRNRHKVDWDNVRSYLMGIWTNAIIWGL